MGLVFEYPTEAFEVPWPTDGREPTRFDGRGASVAGPQLNRAGT